MGFFLRSATGLREWIGKMEKSYGLKKKYFFAWYVINPGNLSLCKVLEDKILTKFSKNGC